AQGSRMTEDDVVRLEQTLAGIHHYKKALRRMGVFQSDERYDKIVKLHLLSHWPKDIRQMGTPDGFSTETPEHMHIESKRAWRASNKDEDVPFHPAWETNLHHTALGLSSQLHVEQQSIRAEGGDEEEDQFDNDEGEDDEQQHYQGRMRTATEAREHVVYPNPTLSIALKPTVSRLRGIDIVAKYGAADLVSALHAYLKKHGTRQLPTEFLPTAYHEYPLWHRLYLRHEALPFDPEWPRRDVIRARPADGNDECAFDVALILDNPDKFGLHRYRAGRVRAIFSLPPSFQYLSSDPLVYVELFTNFSTSSNKYHRLYSLSQMCRFDGQRRTAVVSAFELAAACHLAPRIESLGPELGRSTFPDLLTSCRSFYFNHYYNRYIYRLIEHWRPGIY
ncbi:hypothetical protein FRC09_005197, partial [Ceratobasidium sp. 395]